MLVPLGFTLFSTIGFALISVPLQLLMALGLAALLNSKRLIGKELHRALVFLPSVSHQGCDWVQRADCLQSIMLASR